MAKRRRQPTHFFKIILSPHASKLRIPDEFIMKYEADLQDLVSLEVPSGAKWKVQLQNSNGSAWLKEGWNQFKEYYSIGCGYFVLFQYNGDSHFSVFIFDLSASEIQYRSGPNEDVTPQIVKTAGDAGHRKKAYGPETKNNAYDEKRVKLEIPDEEEDLYFAAQQEKKKIKKDKHVKQTVDKNLDFALANKGKEHCNEVVDVLASKLASTTKRKYPYSLEASHSRHPLRSKQANVVKPKESKGTTHCGKPYKTVVTDSSYSGRQKTVVSEAWHRKKADWPETNNNACDEKRVKLDIPDKEEELYFAAQQEKKEIKKDKHEKRTMDKNLDCAAANKAKEQCNEIVDLTGSKVTNASKRSYSLSLEVSHSRHPLRSKQATVEAKNCAKPNNTVVVDSSYSGRRKTVGPPSCPSVLPERKEDFCCAALSRYPLRSNTLKEVKLEQSEAVGNADNLMFKEQVVADASCSRFPLGSKELKDVKLEQWEAGGNMNDNVNSKNLVAVVSHSRYPLRSKTLKEVKLEQCEAVGNTDNLKLREQVVADALCSSYPLRCKVKLEQWEAGGNMDTLTTENHVVADSPYSKKQKSGRPAKPNRVKLRGKEGCDGVTLAKKHLSAATSQEKGFTLTGARCSELGNLPRFIVSMQPSYVVKNFQLNIPADFARRHFKEGESMVTLRVSDGRTWRAKCTLYPNHGDAGKIHSPGWRYFALDNSLKVHDTCVFELIDGIEPVLDVTIFRAKVGDQVTKEAKWKGASFLEKKKRKA